MSMTTVKKVVGGISFVIGTVATFATTEHITEIQSVLPHNRNVTLVLGILVLVGNLWGKHPLASPSVVDSLKDGTLSQEVASANAD